MQTRLSEREGVRLLREEFEKDGIAIREGVPFEVAGTILFLDGYDPERRVGFEFVTAEAGDRKAFGEGVVAALERKMEEGEAFLLLVDEWDVTDAADLALAARRFLDELRRREVLK
ncbi:MAG: hypothetical protein IPN83_03940 [Holophagales bacterium]|nr:hypothetical protein [Holophagales bacterium]